MMRPRRKKTKRPQKYFPIPDDYILDIGETIFYGSEITILECTVLKNEKDYISFGVKRGHLVEIKESGHTMIADRKYLMISLEQVRYLKLEKLLFLDDTNL